MDSSLIRQTILRSLYVELTKEKERASEALVFCCILFTFAKFAPTNEAIYSATIDNEVDKLLGNRFVTDSRIKNSALKKLHTFGIFTHRNIDKVNINGVKCQGKVSIFVLNPKFLQLSRIIADLTSQYLTNQRINGRIMTQLAKEIYSLSQARLVNREISAELSNIPDKLVNKLTKLSVPMALCFTIHSITQEVTTARQIQDAFASNALIQAHDAKSRLNHTILPKLVKAGILLCRNNTGTLHSAHHIYRISAQQENLAKLLARVWEEYSEKGRVTPNTLMELRSYI